MMIFETLRLAIRSLMAKRVRTMLTMLGIIVGVGSVIVMLAYGEGQKRELLKRFEGLSDRSMSVEFNYRTSGANLKVPRSIHLNESDALAIEQECSAVEFAIPEARARLDVSRGNNNSRAMIRVAGPEIFEIYNTGLAYGKLYTETDNLNRAKVCVIGAAIQDDLFPEMSAVDQYIKVFDHRFRVVGVLRRSASHWLDSGVYVPWWTGRERTDAIPYPTNIRVQVTATSRLELAKRQVREFVHLQYPKVPVPDDIYDDDLSPIRIRSILSWKEEREQTADSFSLLLMVIGGLSLLIGGVGVMNIMLVSVHERTPEIGLRKALGARRRDILSQFLTEAVMLCLIGGGFGMLVAFTVCRYLERMPAEANIPDPVITTWAITIAIGVTLGTGLFFGVYPAVRAARLSPIEALHTG